MTKDNNNKNKNISEIELDNDLNNRVKAFNAELIPLLGKYNLGLGAVAFLMPDGRVGAKPQLFDDKKEELIKPESEPNPESKEDNLSEA